MADPNAWNKTEAAREWRRVHKNRLRAEAAAASPPKRGRYALQDGHVKAWAVEASKMHDAHVREWRSDKARVNRWKYTHDPRYALYHRIKRWMQKHLGDQLPSRKWSQYLGYTPEQLRQHIERQFTKGMGWHNKGEWHIDHIRPVASFDITGVDCPDFAECFGLANLRPVWGAENMRKGARREFLL